MAYPSRKRPRRKLRPSPKPSFPEFDCIIGIDQTGAVDPRTGRARPLPCAVLARKGRRWSLESVTIPALDPASISALVRKAGTKGEVAILADCVFGVALPPGRARISNPASLVWSTLGKTLEVPGFGRGPAERFFVNLLGDWEGDGKFPRRRCERIAGANSIFQTRPFQKNIQTGTFRLWKDIAGARCEWLSIWPFEKRVVPGRPWVFEGFPSYFWKSIFGVRTRDRSRLKQAVDATMGRSVRIDDWVALESSADLADAAVLALGGLTLQREGRLFEPYPGFDCVGELAHEGWIAGLGLG